MSFGSSPAEIYPTETISVKLFPNYILCTSDGKDFDVGRGHTDLAAPSVCYASLKAFQRRTSDSTAQAGTSTCGAIDYTIRGLGV